MKSKSFGTSFRQSSLCVASLPIRTDYGFRRSNTHDCRAQGRSVDGPRGLLLQTTHYYINSCGRGNCTGTDASQGKGQIISNINACLAVQSTIKGTLGPYGGDLLLVDSNGKQTITNDGATVMKVRKIYSTFVGFPAACALATWSLQPFYLFIFFAVLFSNCLVLTAAGHRPPGCSHPH